MNPKPRIIDVSHHQSKVDFLKLRAAGVEGVILKATQGSGYLDPTFHCRAKEVVDAGLLLGAYHFLDGSDPSAQWEHFLTEIQGHRPLLLCLDYERNPSGATASAEHLCTMVHASVKALGRHPVLYGSDLLQQALADPHCDPDVRSCKRWGARYSSKPPRFVCDLWQFTDKARVGGQGPFDASDLVPSAAYPTIADFWRRWAI